MIRLLFRILWAGLLLWVPFVGAAERETIAIIGMGTLEIHYGS
jgi:hypothetical protein